MIFSEKHLCSFLYVIINMYVDIECVFLPLFLSSVFMADTCRPTQNHPKRTTIRVRKSAANHWLPKTSEEEIRGWKINTYLAARFTACAFCAPFLLKPCIAVKYMKSVSAYNVSFGLVNSQSLCIYDLLLTGTWHVTIDKDCKKAQIDLSTKQITIMLSFRKKGFSIYQRQKLN